MPTAIRPIDQQRRLAEVGRIRLGHKVDMQNGKSRPAKLAKFRLTSSDRERLDRAADLYGGSVEAWNDEWELYTDTDAIPIAVIPHQALNVSYELWGQKTNADRTKTPVICLRRCDGRFEAKSDGPCVCAGEEDMTCKPTARLSVIFADVPGLGVWRLESHGWNALSELQGTVELLEALVAIGRPVSARLRLDQRTSANEKGTRKFVVPVIDIDHTIGQVLGALQQGAPGPAPIEVGHAREIEQPAARGMTPVPALPAAERPSVAEQVAATAATERPKRSNAAEPIRPTGVAPRTVDEISGAQRPVPPESGVEGSVGRASPDPSAADDEGPVMPLPQRVAMWCADAGLDDDGRHAFLSAFTEGQISSAKDVTPDMIAGLRSALVRFKRGELELRTGGNNGPRLIDRATALPSSDPAGEHQRGPRPPVQDYSKMKVAELAAECRARGLEPVGSKADLVALLQGAAA